MGTAGPQECVGGKYLLTDKDPDIAELTNDGTMDVSPESSLVVVKTINCV